MIVARAYGSVFLSPEGLQQQQPEGPIIVFSCRVGCMASYARSLCPRTDRETSCLLSRVTKSDSDVRLAEMSFSETSKLA